MKTFRNRDGFTLVEMLVVILVGSIVTLATVTVLLLGVRMQKKTTNTVQQQNASRIILSSLNQLAAESDIQKLISGTDSWYVCSTKTDAPTEENTPVVDSVLLAYDSASGCISSGGKVTTSMIAGELVYTYADGETVLDGVYASHAVLKENLLTFAVETKEGSYTSSTYCRITPKSVQDAVIEDLEQDEDKVIEDNLEPVGPLTTTAARKEFLKRVTAQRGSPGLILEEVKVGEKTLYLSAGRYFSQWHIGDGWGSNGWDEETPWCACFVTWALDVPTQGTEKTTVTETVDGNKVEKEVTYESRFLRTPVLGRNINGLANVDKFIAYLDGPYQEAVYQKDEAAKEAGTKYWHPTKLAPKLLENGEYEIASTVEDDYAPLPGELIFFDWIIDANDDSDHVGVVLTVNNGYVYTVEGNSADMVAVRRYKLDDPRIMGYGVLDWKLGVEAPADTEQTQEDPNG